MPRNDKSTVSGLRALLIDLDGTVYFKGQPIPGVQAALQQLQQRGLRRLFLTNVDSRTPAELALQMRGMGLDIEAGEIFTCAQAGLAYVRARSGQPFCLLPSGLAAEFEALGRQSDPVRFVVVGDPRQTTAYATLNSALRHIMAGAEIVALQRGRYFITAEGPNLDTGAIVALLEYASGRDAVLMGKPASPFFLAALDRLGLAAEDVIVVGDDVRTDIAGAAALGLRSVLVRTGMFAHQPPPPGGPAPAWTIDSLAALPGLIALDMEAS